MESIRSYLENMFLNLPQTPQVLKAKNELFQMMEDKYTELKEEGKTENEAVGTVISEFGNLDELAEELGIGEVWNVQENHVECTTIGIETVKQYLHDQTGFAYRIAGGVATCILAIAVMAFSDALLAAESMYAEAWGAAIMMLMIAATVGLFVYSGIRIGKWNDLRTQSCALDFEAKNYVSEKKQNYTTTYVVLLTVGIVLCTVSFIPAVILDDWKPVCSLVDSDDLGGVLFLVLVAIGVFMILLPVIINKKYNFLLNLNGTAQPAGSKVQNMTEENKPKKEEEQWKHPAMAAIMSVYWQTVTCLFLIWSFLSFDWWITWIIWPVASIVYAILKKVFRNW